jgi:Arc/MetJ family transcription regulator
MDEMEIHPVHHEYSPSTRAAVGPMVRRVVGRAGREEAAGGMRGATGVAVQVRANPRTSKA